MNLVALRFVVHVKASYPLKNLNNVIGKNLGCVPSACNCMPIFNQPHPLSRVAAFSNHYSCPSNFGVKYVCLITRKRN